MAVQAVEQNNLILKQTILGSRRLSNFVWGTVAAIGGIGFLLAGLSSYFHINLLLVSDPSGLLFFPQGVALTFYGVAGTAVFLYQLFVIVLDVGAGYNEFNKKIGVVTIFRWGFLGKNRQIQIDYDLDRIQAVRAEIKEGFNAKRALYLRIQGARDIPITRVGDPLSLSELENQGATLARFLEVPLEGL
ncbi:MAG: photosystem I assembly protein Ycf4 [Spirulina sp. SIO3F2]|nr:photosystem I assembly protein Ycf4 [Spirulina sp. SIO3F2]